jgi:DNA-binding NarL/FixJ family response regulator
MLKAGVSGYLLKDCAFEELANAIHAVMKDQIYLCPPIAKTVTEDYLHRLGQTNASSVYTILTLREREVLKLLSEGKTTKQIANTLGLSGKTIETHARKVMKKLSLHSIAELTKYAIREGLTTLEP